MGNSVGYAVAAKMAAAHFNTATHKVFDQKIVCLAGDGCLQEGEFNAYAKPNNIYKQLQVFLERQALLLVTLDWTTLFCCI